MYKYLQKNVIYVILIGSLSSCSLWHRIKQFVGIEKSTIESNYSLREIERVIATGRKFIGVPYKVGGVDDKGMDCSGLLFRMYDIQGYQIPRLSRDQSNFGLPVSLTDIQIGDWIFFRTNKSTVVNHAGIVTASKGGFDVQFLHASTSKGVREDNLNNKYWANAIYKVIRPFKN